MSGIDTSWQFRSARWRGRWARSQSSLGHPSMGNFSEAIAAEVQRLREALERIIRTPGIDVERLKAIAREALEK